jgi:hypothetical protein
METRACSSVLNTKPRWAPGAHQRHPDIAPAWPASPPNSAWYHTEAGLRGWRCCLYFARILLASSIYKNTALHSGGRSHAHGMASQLPCGFIAQQCLVLAPFSLIVLFIADVAPQAAGKVMTLWPRDNGVCSLCIIKGNDITFPDSRRLCRLCINVAPQRSHGYGNSSISGQFVIFWVVRASPTTVDPWPRSLRYKTKLDHVSEGPAPKLAPLRRQLHGLLSTTWWILFTPARLCVLVHPLWLCM